MTMAQMPIRETFQALEAGFQSKEQTIKAILFAQR
jgi:hypothetical protein